MKKKIITALTALMVLSMGTTVFAATSPVADVPGTTAVEKVTMTNASGQEIEVTITEVTDATAKAEAKEMEKTTTKEVVTVVAVVEVPAEAKNTPVTFKVDGVKAGDNISVMHWDATAQKWESTSVKNVVVGNGTVTATFTELSPIAIVKSEPTQAAKDEAALQAWIWSNMQAGSNNATSPKTFDATLGLMAMAALCGAGAAVCNKKSK